MVVGEHNRTIVYFADSLSITYYRVGAMGAVSSRDFLDLRSLCQLEGNQGFLVVFYSVAWPDQPLVPGCVRVGACDCVVRGCVLVRRSSPVRACLLLCLRVGGCGQGGAGHEPGDGAAHSASA
jgi:hypothetical protein